MKKTNKILVSTLALLGLLSGCDTNTPEKKPVDDDDNPPYEEEVITFEEILGEQTQIELSKNENKEYLINKAIDSSNYLQILLNTTGRVTGEIAYAEKDYPTHVVKEEFYIEPTKEGEDATDFRQFLDAFRPEGMSIGLFDKTLKSIKFTNVSNGAINITLKQVNISDREIPEEDKMIFLEKDSLKIGMDLLTGGTLSYLERVDYDGDSVDLVLDRNNKLQIGVDYASRENTTETYSNHVNLINIYDAGRQIQQSYYASIGGYGTTEEEKKNIENDDGGTQNGYTRNISVTASKAGYYWPYNPVQGGDEAVNLSQVIDYRKTEDELYCKTRALDWAAHESRSADVPCGNRVTKSYMENWFKIKDGMVFVTNRFIDWNGFYDLNGIPGHNIEIPATYISQPLNTFQAYLGTEAFKEDAQGNLDSTPGILEKNNNLGPWKNGGHRTQTHVEDWFAWTNSEDFGVGVYIPGADYYSSGRSAVGTGVNDKNPEGIALNKGAKASPMAKEFLYNKPEAVNDFDPCYVRNTSYTAPVKQVKMKEYIPLEYSYVLAVDYVEVFREAFKVLYEEGEISSFNAQGLNAWGA